MIFKVVGNQRWAKRSGWVNSTTGVINLGGGKRTSGEALMHMWHLHYTGGQVAAWFRCTQQLHSSHPRGERLFAMRLSCPNRETGPTAATPPRCAIPSVIATTTWPKKEGSCMSQKQGQPLKKKEKEQTIISPSSSYFHWPILRWDIADINCER